jgi:hypothetical protein
VTSVLDAPWFFWAVGVAVGFPLALLVLTEIQNALRRRGCATTSCRWARCWCC